LERAHGRHWLPQELQARQEALRKGRANLDTQMDRLTQAYLAAIIPLEEYQRRRRSLEERIQALETQMTQLEAQVDRRAEVVGLVSSIEAFCQRVQASLTHATFEQKRRLVELLIDRVIVTDEDVEIRYVIPTHPRSEHVRFCQLRKDYFDDVVQILHLPDDDWVPCSLLSRLMAASLASLPSMVIVSGTPFRQMAFLRNRHAAS
jgi:site-specific DNA recombinase